MSKAPYKRVMLDRKVNFFLAQKVQDDYTTSGMTDSQFAEVCAKELDAPVNGNHIFNTRNVFSIPSNSARIKGGASNKVSELERRVKVLEDRFDIWVQGSRKLKE